MATHPTFHRCQDEAIILQEFCVTESIDTNKLPRVDDVGQCLVVDVYLLSHEIQLSFHLTLDIFKTKLVHKREVIHDLACQSLHEQIDINL